MSQLSHNPHAQYWNHANDPERQIENKPLTMPRCFAPGNQCKCPLHCHQKGKCSGFELKDLTADQKFKLMFGQSL